MPEHLHSPEESEAPSDRMTGRSLRRREDGPLLTGEATYTDDISAPGMVHAAVLRTQHGHARVGDIDTSAAAALDGVLAVYTGADVEASDAPGVVSAPAVAPNGVATDLPMLATERVRYAGEALAVVVAEDRYVAHDAVDRIDVEYERLDAVVDPREAQKEDAPVVHDHAPDNVAFDWEFGDEDATDEAFADADRVTSIDVRNQRLVGNPMEPRAVLAEWDDREGLTVTQSSQTPYDDREHFVNTLGIDDDEIRVVAPSVGGGFGIKGQQHVEEVVAAWCAMELDRPVKWTCTRTETHVADTQSRDWYLAGSMALDDDGTIRALRIEADHTVGAYYRFPPTLAGNIEALVAGQYEVPAVDGRVVGTFTNTAPVGPYRGAGRPEAIYFLERLVRAAARHLDLDPAEFRRHNQIPADAFPYETATGMVYDSGDYERALDLALDHADYDAVRERQAALRQEGRYLGVGLSCFVENTGSGPGLGETGRVLVNDDGSVTAHLGTHDHGQGHETTFAQLLSDELGVDYDDVEIEEGDTQYLEEGTGTFGSRSAALGGSAMIQAAAEVKERAREVAATRLEAASEDIEFADGEFFVAGAPDRSVTLAEVAALAADADVDLDATAHYDPPNFGWAFGTHVAVVEVDPDTGEVEFEDYVAVDDCGEVINPLIVEGQIHGGVAQGIGQALYEEAVYDDNGTLVTGSFQDYALPKSFHVPEMTTDETVTPSPHNPLGVKGTGESGTIAATPAVVNAVLDALEPFGVEDIDMPLTAERVWQAMREADAGAGDE